MAATAENNNGVAVALESIGDRGDNDVLVELSPPLKGEKLNDGNVDELENNRVFDENSISELENNRVFDENSISESNQVVEELAPLSSPPQFDSSAVKEYRHPVGNDVDFQDVDGKLFDENDQIGLHGGDPHLDSNGLSADGSNLTEAASKDESLNEREGEGNNLATEDTLESGNLDLSRPIDGQLLPIEGYAVDENFKIEDGQSLPIECYAVDENFKIEDGQSLPIEGYAVDENFKIADGALQTMGSKNNGYEINEVIVEEDSPVMDNVSGGHHELPSRIVQDDEEGMPLNSIPEVYIEERSVVVDDDDAEKEEVVLVGRVLQPTSSGTEEDVIAMGWESFDKQEEEQQCQESSSKEEPRQELQQPPLIKEENEEIELEKSKQEEQHPSESESDGGPSQDSSGSGSSVLVSHEHPRENESDGVGGPSPDSASIGLSALLSREHPSENGSIGGSSQDSIGSVSSHLESRSLVSQTQENPINGKSDHVDGMNSLKELAKSPEDSNSRGAQVSSDAKSPAKLLSAVTLDANSTSDATLSAKPSPSGGGNSLSDPGAPARPAGLGFSAAPLLERAHRPHQQPRSASVGQSQQQHHPQIVEESNGESAADEESGTREKLQMIRVKFLRLASRLGQTPHNPVVAQVLYRLGLAEQLRGGGRTGAFSFDRASAMAEQLEAAGQEPLDFSCTIMLIGKTGVGKSATINSIFDEVKFDTDAFKTRTKRVQEISGTVQGIKVRVIDTPGLLSSFIDQRENEKNLRSVKNFMKKIQPDIILYVDRLDMQSRDYNDLPLLRSITEVFSSSVWLNAIVVLTHAASAPPDGPNGAPLSYEMFVTQRSHVVQQAIRQATGDMRLMNPVSLVENHSACRTNRAGQRVLPNGQVWKSQLLLLSFASKILSEANSLLNLQTQLLGKPFSGLRSRVPPLPFLLSSMLQSRPQLKLPDEQFEDDEALDDDLDDVSDSDEAYEYDELPPFKRLTEAQISKLTKEQRKAYFDEVEYRERLFMEKQLKEERKRRRRMKKMAETVKDQAPEHDDVGEEENPHSAEVPVPMPDVTLPSSFGSDNPTHRYRGLECPLNPWLVRPVLENNGWDHDVGYEGLNVERLFIIKDKVPVSFSGQITKDKKESSLQVECASSIKHGEGKSTSLGFDIQTVGKDMAYTLRSETRFSNHKRNKAAAGLSVTLLGDALTAGLKFEDRLVVHKHFKMVMTGGAMAGRGDIAYGGSLEATLRDQDYPIGKMLTTLGLSVMDWHGDLAVGCNLQSQFPVGRGTNMIARANMNNRGAGQVSIRLSSSEQLMMALLGILPLLRNLAKTKLIWSSQSMQ